MNFLTIISLFFDVFIDKELEKKVPTHAEIIRLWCLVQFKRQKDWTIPYPALIDTGAHTTIIPNENIPNKPLLNTIAKFKNLIAVVITVLFILDFILCLAIQRY